MNIQLNVLPFPLEIRRHVRCSLYSTFPAKYTAHQSVFAHLLPNTADLLLFTLFRLGSRQIQYYCSTTYPGFNIQLNVSPFPLEIRRHVRCALCSTFADKYTAPATGLHYVNSGPGPMQCYCSTAYWGFNIQLNVSTLLFLITRQFDARYSQHMLPNTAPFSRFLLCKLWSLPNPL
jgi:hypothetical protein